MGEISTLGCGVMLFCAGTLLGIPHGLSKRASDIRRTELWRIAHLSTCVGGVALMALGPALYRLIGAGARLPCALFVISACLFFLACSMSGILNASWDGNSSRRAVRVIYRLQIAASIVSVGAVVLTIGFMGVAVCIR